MQEKNCYTQRVVTQWSCHSPLLSKHRLLKPTTKLLKPGDDLLPQAKAKAWRGEQPRDYERQLGASGGDRSVQHAPGPGEIKGTCALKGSTC